jgi:peroxiredoxin (alkyl hydroperoxide reductase subunit C)
LYLSVNKEFANHIALPNQISLEDYLGRYVVIFFYTADFTFVCPTEIIQFNDRSPEFDEIGCTVIGCSTDSHFSHLAWCEKPRKQGGLGDMQIPLLADHNLQVTSAYGCLDAKTGFP